MSASRGRAKRSLPPPASSASVIAPTPLLVRLGIRYFRDLSSRRRLADAVDAVHFLNADERKALRRIERGAIVRAAVAGALSTIVAGALEVVVAIPLYGHARATLDDQVRYYAIVGAA